MRIFIVIGLMLMAMIACKKDYTCECYQKYSDSDSSWTTYQSDTLLSVRKAKSEEACNAFDSEPLTTGSLTVYLDCELK